MSYAFASMGSGRGSTDPMDMSDAELDALIASRFDENGFFSLDDAIAFQPPSLPQWTVDLAVGAGDGVWNAITMPARLFTDNPATLSDIRGMIGIDGAVGYDSGAYRASYVGGNVLGGTALYGGAAFRYVPALGPSGQLIGHPAYGGRSHFNALRSGSLRFGWGRDGGPVLRIGVRNRHIDVMRRPNPN